MDDPIILDYKINIITGVYDNHFCMINALVDFLNNNTFTWIDTKELFTIKKGLHEDTFGLHFTFVHRGFSYHAYVKKVYILFNGRHQETRLKIVSITALTIYGNIK